jgi:hypothetical protein
MIERAWDYNDDGGGLAWREKNKAGENVVIWRKGIEDVKEMKELMKKLPLPYVAHFRVASSGGVTRQLTHPFPITKLAQLHTGGTTKGWVLFHNGDWKEWSDAARLAAIHSNTPIPPGKFSDTRAIAWLCSIYGLGFMEFLPGQRGIAFGPNDEDLEVFTGPGWIKINQEVWCSNDHFWLKTRLRNGGTFPSGNTQGNYTPIGVLDVEYCTYRTCVETEKLDKNGYCPLHLKESQEVDTKKKIEAGSTGGTQPAADPFRGPIQLVSLEMAERLNSEEDKFGNKKLSNSKIKQFRKLYARIGEGGKPAEAARKDLLALSLKVINSIQSTGSVH